MEDRIITKVKELKQMSLVDYTFIEIKDNGEPIIDLASLGFILDPMYFKDGLTDTPKMYLREGLVKKLKNAEKKLNGLRFKLWDGYRSRDVQNNIYQKFWKELHELHPKWSDEKLQEEAGRFLSPPFGLRIPPHSTGGSIDLTLVDKEGKELDMGTGFDCFTKKSAPFYYEIYRDKKQIRTNRRILRSVMGSEGFTMDDDEWWHFDFGNQMWALKSGKMFAVYGECIINSQ